MCGCIEWFTLGIDTRKACTMQMESIAWQRHSPPSHRHQVFSSKFIASNDSGRLRSVGLPAEGLEPTRSCDHWILSPARLPVPPRRRRECETTRMRRKLKRFQRDGEVAPVLQVAAEHLCAAQSAAAVSPSSVARALREICECVLGPIRLTLA